MPTDSSSPWWPWALIAAAVAAVGAWFAVVWSRRRRWDASFTRNLSEARRAVDSLVPSATNRLLPADQVTQQWLDGKRRLDDLQSDLYRLGTDIPTPSRATRLGQVSGSLGALQQALEHDVALRSTATAAPDDAMALDASLQTVSHRREELVAAIEDRPPVASHRAP